MKMFVLVRKDLSKSQQGVQGGHALAQYALDHSEEFKIWGNHTIVYLKVDYDYLRIFESNEKFSCFYEPDIGNQLTAIATYSSGDRYGVLKLM